jgi:hypothetical protein
MVPLIGKRMRVMTGRQDFGQDCLDLGESSFIRAEVVAAGSLTPPAIAGGAFLNP